VILGIQKQPTADTIHLTRSIEAALEEMKKSLPAGMEAPQVTFRQASFIEASIGTLQGKLIGASVFVAAILFFFLGTLRPTVIALTAIPVSIFMTALVFKYFGLSINTMTLGRSGDCDRRAGRRCGGGRRERAAPLKEDRAKHHDHRLHPIELVAHATMEVRSAILYATIIIVLVFLPLFALPGMEGRLFVPLGVAFIVSTLASLVVSVTVTPVLSFYLLPRMKSLDHGDTRVLAWLKARYRNGLQAVLEHPKGCRVRSGCGRGDRRGRRRAVLSRPRFCRRSTKAPADRHAAQPGRDPGRVHRACTTGGGAGETGARGDARRSPQRTGRTRRACGRRPCQRTRCRAQGRRR
jgi:HME family heavy-metal exporter